MPSREDVESRVLSAVCGDAMWKTLETFGNIDRVSGSQGDFQAVDYVVSYLKGHGIPVDVYEFDSLISRPMRGSLRCVAPEEREIHCKTRAFSACTPPAGLRGEVIYVPTRSGGVGILEGATEDEYAGIDARGKIVLSMRGGPDAVWDAQRHGAIGLIHVWSSGEDVLHEMIATPVWGTPTPETAHMVPTIPIGSVKKSDGEWLISLTHQGKVEVILRTEVDTRWRQLRLPVAEIRGSTEPDEFVLVGGHLDSWYVGITDNATGNATCMEMARVLFEHREHLRRSVRVAWWPGHSYGRYSGSTWYADNFWQDLHKNCVGYDNIDSPGCLGAIDYSEVTAMAEDKAFVEKVVLEITGQKTRGVRPVRAGDQSFWGHGVPSLFMLLSNRPDQSAVGGSAGGWWWHSEYDTLDKADKKIQVQDTRLHLLAVLRLANAEVLPFDFVDVADEALGAIRDYAAGATAVSDAGSVLAAVEEFRLRAAKLNEAICSISGPGCCQGKAALLNDCLKGLSRLINPVSYTVTGPFDQDPATPTRPYPGLVSLKTLAALSPGTNEYGFTLTRLLRECNRTIDAFRQASRLVDETLGRLG
jgi:hypothetical protein